MIKAILAVDAEMGIGKNGTLPWPANKEDLNQFKDKTTGHIVVMGSKTWDDPLMPKPLPNRCNVVVTSRPLDYYPTAHNCIGGDYKSEILKLAELEERDIWIIGGAEIIDHCKDIIEEWHITKIHGIYDCDRFLDLPSNLMMESYTATNENSYSILRRVP